MNTKHNLSCQLGLHTFIAPSRFVRWSDGSLQLMIGAEVFDVSEHDMALDNHFVFMSHPGGVIQVCTTLTLDLLLQLRRDCPLYHSPATLESLTTGTGLATAQDGLPACKPRKSIA